MPSFASRRSIPRPRTRFAAWLLILLAACHTDPVGVASNDVEIAEIIFVDPAGRDVLYSHGDHFHGALRVFLGDTLTLAVQFVEASQASHDAPMQSARFSLKDRPEFQLRVSLADPTVVAWEGDHVTAQLIGRYPGATVATIQVRRGARVLYEAPGVPIAVSP